MIFLASIESPLWISLKVAVVATLGASGFAIFAAWQLNRRSGPLPALLDSLCALPLVLPPTVIGYYLIVVVGKHGLLGPVLTDAGINLIFSWKGAVLAAAVVIFPLIYRTSRGALAQVNKDLEDVARSLGAPEWRIFLSISLPLAWRGISSGILLAFCRGMGEFGATLMIAGNIPGKTQTLALAIYSAFQAGDDQLALKLVIFTSAVCCLFLTGAELLLKTR